MKRYKVQASKSESEKTAEILVHGPIGKSFWSDEGISGKEFTDELNDIPKGYKITVGINSQGGSIGEGLAIFNAIARRSEDVTARIDGYALSIASFFPLAASKIVSPKSSIWMIHNAWNWSQGNAKQLRKDADMLEKHDDTLVAAYVERTGKSAKEVRAAMDEETWLTGEEAMDWGLADETNDEEVALDSLDFSPMNQRTFKKIPTSFAMAIAGMDSKNGAEYNMTGINAVLNALDNFKISAANRGDNKTNTTGNTMNKKLIVALLEKHGIDSAETESEEVLQSKLDKIPKAAAAAPDSDNVISLQEIRAQLAAERKSRITSEVNRRAENRIQNDKLQWWLDLAIAAKTTEAENAVYAQIDALPVNSPGGSPLGVTGSGIEMISDPMGFLDRSTPEQRFPGTPMAELRAKHTDIPTRIKVMKDSWSQLFSDACSRDRRRGLMPMNTNTYSATLVTSFLLDGSLTPLQNRWAMMNAFTKDYSQDPYKPLATAVLKNPTAGATAQQDATNWESGNSTVAPISVTMHQQSVSDQVSNSDLNSGLRLIDLSIINAAVFANTVIEKAEAPMTTANFQTTGGQTNLVVPAAAFGFSDLATLQGQLQKSTIMNVILDGTYRARVANTPAFFQQSGTINGTNNGLEAFGWDGVYVNSDWAGAEANVKGFACNPQAIVAVTGLPLIPPNIPGGILSTQTATLPGVNISFAMSLWFNTSTRTMWCSWDVMLGIALGDATAGVLIKQA